MQGEVLDRLWDRLRELGSGDAVLLAVPGNHDLFRPDLAEDNPAADYLLAHDGFLHIEDKFWGQPGGGYRRLVDSAFAAYTEWWETAPNRPLGLKKGILPGDFSATIQCGSRRVGIVGLNTTFLQLGGGHYEARLVWNARQLHAVCEPGVDVWSKQHDVSLLLTHQGPNWLTPEARKHGESEIAPPGRFALHLFGHQHETEMIYIRRGGSTKAIRLCQGASVFGLEKFGDPPVDKRIHGFSAGRIEFAEGGGILRLWPQIATCGTGPWRFVPDNQRAELANDGGTVEEAVPIRESAGIPRQSAANIQSVFSPHSTLPARRPFFGRKHDLEKIEAFLRPEDRSWGVVLDGPGGVGKTALALEAAHRAPAEHFPLKLWITAKTRELVPHGEYPLTDHHVDDFQAMLRELSRALARDDIATARPEERPSLVRHALAGHRALLVLDNLETFGVEDRRRVFELLATLPVNCRAIVSSRRRTDGSNAAHTLRVDKLERDAADELLSELGKGWEPIARLSVDDRDRLYAETGGNPLLLTWTAGQLGRTTGRCRTVEEAIERLQEAHRLQKMDANNDPLNYVFGDLVDTFTTDETDVLAALVHFTQPATLDWLLPLTGLSSKAAETALDGLRDRALLVEDDNRGTWILPPLAAKFLRRARPEAVGVAGERLAHQVYALIAENGSNRYERFHILESAWPQIAAAVPILITDENRRLQIACWGLFDFLHFSGRWDDLIILNTEAEVKAAREHDYYQAGGRAYHAGWGFYFRGQPSEVLACAERAAAHWQSMHTRAHERACALQLESAGHRLAGDYEKAITISRQAVRLWRTQSGWSKGLGLGLSSLASALRAAGQFDEAESHYREALSLARPYPENFALYTANLADLEVDRERWSVGEEIAREAVKLASGIGNKSLTASASQCLAVCLVRQGRAPEGRYHAERAVALFSELHSPQLLRAQATLNDCIAKTG